MNDSTPLEYPDGSPTGWQHRVIYHRAGWSTGRLAYFAHIADAEAFAAKLQADDRPELAELTHLAIHSRPVGTWVKHRIDIAA